MAKRESTARLAEKLALPILEGMGLALWDVRFVKEGPLRYLRYFIDREGGVTIGDCEDFSRRVEAELDREDPIPERYVLEVSSPGVERELTRPGHFEAWRGKPVTARLIRPAGGVRELSGTLVGVRDGTLILSAPDGSETEVRLSDTASVRARCDFGGGNG